MKRNAAQLQSEIDAYRKASVETIARHFYNVAWMDCVTEIAKLKAEIARLQGLLGPMANKVMRTEFALLQATGEMGEDEIRIEP